MLPQYWSERSKDFHVGHPRTGRGNEVVHSLGQPQGKVLKVEGREALAEGGLQASEAKNAQSRDLNLAFAPDAAACGTSSAVDDADSCRW